MDNLTHSMVGLVVAKAGLGRLSPYATAACVLAANAPDVDVLTRLRGQWVALEQHRGVTHSVVGTLALGLLLPLACFALERLITRLGGWTPRIRLKGLTLATVAACATHPVLDWLNSYGVRPLLPWDGRWVYGDILFVLDPWVWLLLGGAAFLLTVRGRRWRLVLWGAFALVLTLAVLTVARAGGLSGRARVLWCVGLALILLAWRVRLAERLGARLAHGALALFVAYCVALAALHAVALRRAGAAGAELARARGESVLRVAAMPTLADPTGWQSVVETDAAYYRFETRLAAGATGAPAQFARFEKPSAAQAAQVARAEQDWRARVFLGFARFPAVRLQPADAGATRVQFADLRFAAPDQARNSGRAFALEVLVESSDE
ncbi:MAG TPA: metal-dependent hydrolase [Pyrinomonadaceae bacterium]|jgi:inner membrane protein